MKKAFFILTSFLSIFLFVSCEFFAKPLFTLSRDISGVVKSMSTSNLVANIDKLATDPNKAADVLNELANRNTEELTKLSTTEKESILNAGVGALLPTSTLGETVEKILKNKDTDPNQIIETLTKGIPEVNTKALETILSDPTVLENADASTLTLSAASLIVATVKNETKGGTVEEKMQDFIDAVNDAGGNGAEYKEETFEQALEGKGFSEESVNSLSTVIKTAQVLTGLAGEGQPDRSEDVSNMSFGGMNIGDLLDKLTGGN